MIEDLRDQRKMTAEIQDAMDADDSEAQNA
jgi:hypothetical protein